MAQRMGTVQDIMCNTDRLFLCICNSPGYKVTIDSLSRVASENTRAVNHLQIMYLIIQGCIVCILAALYASWLLHRLQEQRYRLFSVFVAVPQGFVRALATKQVRASVVEVPL